MHCEIPASINTYSSLIKPGIKVWSRFQSSVVNAESKKIILPPDGDFNDIAKIYPSEQFYPPDLDHRIKKTTFVRL